jgi:Family of unknown function (DUF6223)
MVVQHLLDAVQPTSYGLTAGRFWSLVGAVVAVAGVVIGGLVLARSRRIGAGFRRRGPVVSLAAGLIGIVVGGLVVAAAEGGPGTGYGIVGGYVDLVVGGIAVVLGVLALTRARRTVS